MLENERQSEQVLCQLAAGYRGLLGQLYHPLRQATNAVEELRRAEHGKLNEHQRDDARLTRFKSLVMIAFVLLRAWKKLVSKSSTARLAVFSPCPFQVHASHRLEERIVSCWCWMERQEAIIGEVPLSQNAISEFQGLFTKLAGFYWTALNPIQGFTITHARELCSNRRSDSALGARAKEIELASWALWVTWSAAYTASEILPQGTAIFTPMTLLRVKELDPDSLAKQCLEVHKLLSQCERTGKAAQTTSNKPPSKSKRGKKKQPSRHSTHVFATA